MEILKQQPTVDSRAEQKNRKMEKLWEEVKRYLALDLRIKHISAQSIFSLTRGSGPREVSLARKIKKLVQAEELIDWAFQNGKLKRADFSKLSKKTQFHEPLYEFAE